MTARHPAFQVVHAPNDYATSRDRYSVFLAGSIDMGKAEDWQKKFCDAVSDFPILILNPRRDDFDASQEQDITNPYFREQVEWELDAINAVETVVMYFDPNGKAPITLLELGLLARSHTRVLVCCPKGYWRRGNVQVVCRRHGIKLFDTLDELIAAYRNTIPGKPYVEGDCLHTDVEKGGYDGERFPRYPLRYGSAEVDVCRACGAWNMPEYSPREWHPGPYLEAFQKRMDGQDEC
jgi:hypothetical protein